MKLTNLKGFSFLNFLNPLKFVLFISSYDVFIELLKTHINVLKNVWNKKRKLYEINKEFFY